MPRTAMQCHRMTCTGAVGAGARAPRSAALCEAPFPRLLAWGAVGVVPRPPSAAAQSATRYLKSVSALCEPEYAEPSPVLFF